MSPPVSGGGGNAACAPQHHTPPIFFPGKENGRCDRPKERRLHCKRAARRAATLADCTAIARRSRVAVAIRFASAPIIRCCAAVGGSAALRMRHTPCGCRSAHLVEVRTNFRLPIVPTNAASAAMPLFRKQSAAVLPSLAPHDSKARLIVVTTRRDSWRSHVHRTHTAQRVQFGRPLAPPAGGAIPKPAAAKTK